MSEPAKKPRRRRALFGALAVLSPLTLAFAAGEVFVRLRYEVVATRPFILADEGPYAGQGIYRAVPPPQLWAHVPDYRGFYHQQTEKLPVSTNELGLRDPPLTPARTGAARRVLFIGDSITMGRGVADGQDFPALLGPRWARSLGLDVATFNAGVAGYDTVQELAMLRDVGPRLSPHVVVVGWYRNDVMVPSVEARTEIIEGQFVPPGGQEEYRRWKARYITNTATPLDWSALIRLLRMWWKNWKTVQNLDERAEEAVPMGETAGMLRSQQALKDMKAWCDERGARLAVVLFPAREEVEAETLMPHPQHLRAMKAFCDDQRLPCLDLFDRWREWAAAHRGETLYLPRDRCHPNPPGHAQVAAWIEEGFSELVKGAHAP